MAENIVNDDMSRVFVVLAVEIVIHVGQPLQAQISSGKFF